MPKDIKSISRYVFEEVWNKGNLAAADEFVSPDYLLHDPNLPGIRGVDSLKQMISEFRLAIPDVHMTVEDQITEGDKVVTRFTSLGTHTNNLLGIPASGKQITVIGFLITRFVDGKIHEEWSNWDRLGLLQQIGAFPNG